MVQHHDAMVARYRTGEPLQYVLGRWGFRRLDLAVDRRVLIPRPETELVVEAVLDAVRELPTRHVADLGTGSGAIGLALADELPLDGTEIWITDVSDDALDVARANLAGLGRAARNVRVGAGSWFEALPDGVRFDAIVSNPPYVAAESPMLDASVRDWEPELALIAGNDGLDAYRVIVPGARHHLVAGGWLVLEIGTDQGDAVRAMCWEAGYPDVDVRRDLAGHDRVVVARVP
jgi:release factor glutamine methyltransferase